MIDLDLLVILDRSGSMQDRKADHEGGLRSFVEDQRRLAGDVRFTLVQFDTTDPCEIVYDRVPLDRVETVTLIPRGGTPLLDAVGKAIAHLRIAQAKEPAAQTVVLIVTDGHENASHEWTKPRIVELLAEVKQAGMQTLFLGAGIDAFDEAGAMGIGMGNALNVPNMGANVMAAYAVTSSKVRSARGMAASGASGQAIADSYNYTADERATVTAGGGGMFDGSGQFGAGGTFTPSGETGTYSGGPVTITPTPPVTITTTTPDKKE